MNTDDGITVSSPIYLISDVQACNLCGHPNRVVALATNNLIDEEMEASEEDGFLLSFVEKLPPEILAAVRQKHPNFGRRFCGRLAACCRCNATHLQFD